MRCATCDRELDPRKRVLTATHTGQVVCGVACAAENADLQRDQDAPGAAAWVLLWLSSATAISRSVIAANERAELRG